MTWAVLDAASTFDRALWIRQWEEWPDREVAAHPAYLQLFAKPSETVACATWTSDEYNALFPFILRPISDLPWACNTDRLDLEGPYGYGGPFWWGSRTGDAETFWGAFDQWAADTGVVSAFARLSLFSEELLPLLRGETSLVQKNVVRDLGLDDAALLRDYQHKVRKNVKKAIASGLSVEFDEHGSRLDEFIAVYNSTMDRRAADDRYRFDMRFFDHLRKGLPGQFVFAHATLDGRVVSTELVLLSASEAYSFLGGTLSESFPLRPNDLLKHEIAKWARDHGKSAYVLGGGYGGDDGIYRYKKSFAPHGERDFFVWRYVIDNEAYARTESTRREHETAAHAHWEPRSDFFPTYRG